MGSGMSRNQTPVEPWPPSRPVFLNLRSQQKCAKCKSGLRKRRAGTEQHDGCNGCRELSDAAPTHEICIYDYPHLMAHLHSPKYKSAIGNLIFGPECSLGAFRCSICTAHGFVNNHAFDKFEKLYEMDLSPMTRQGSVHEYGHNLFKIGTDTFWFWCRARNGAAYMGVQYMGHYEVAEFLGYYICICGDRGDLRYSFSHNVHLGTDSIDEIENSGKCFSIADHVLNKIICDPKSKIAMLVVDTRNFPKETDTEDN